ncbi:MAG: sugar phosphate isomerase/epimerase [Candidatus Aureabacteria bacterium]|nr:sugar phosphate isomerase/epimerase [Candidatus Auribacterota bacterium]
MTHPEKYRINDFALSTSLFGLSYSKAEQVIRSVKGFGFGKVELGFMHSNAFIHNFSSIYKDNGITVESLHNFCPYPVTHKYPISPDIYNLSSENADEREKAVSNTLNTIDNAMELGARAVVLHLGYIPMNRLNKLVFNMYRKKVPENIYNLFLRHFLARRRRLSDKYLSYTMSALDKIVSRAKKNRIRIGIETRMYPHEVPDMTELGAILKKFNDPVLGYWHDTGHAEIKKKMKIEDSDRYFREYSGRIIGIHLHDARGISDHMAPGMGDIDFDAVLSAIPCDTIKVIEVHKPCEDAELMKGSEYLQRKWLEIREKHGGRQ